MEFICPACSTRLVVNGERIRGKRVGFVCKACSTSVEVDGRSDPPAIQAREKRVHSPRTSSPALALELPSPLEPIDAAPPPPPVRRRATPPPLPKRASVPPSVGQPHELDPPRAAHPSAPPLGRRTARPELPPIGPTSEPSLPVGMTTVPPVELSPRASRPDRVSTPPLTSPGVVEAAERMRRRRVQTWLSATGLLAALLGGYGLGVLTAAPAPKSAAVADARPPPAPPASMGMAAAEAPSVAVPAPVETSAPTVISIDDLPIAKGDRARPTKRKPRARVVEARVAGIDEQALVDAMRDASRAAAACSTPGGPRGTSRIAVTVAPDGRVANSVLEGGAIFGSVEARCIEEKFRAVRVPPFRGRPVTAHKTVRLR